MKIRLYRPEDETAVREIFAKQGVEADLPLPWIDPAVAVALVAEDDDGRVVMALIGRQTVEAHLVIAPEESEKHNTAMLFNAAMLYAEGAMMAISAAAQEKKCAAITDTIAYVPNNMPRMHDMIQNLGFCKEPPSFTAYWKTLGETNGTRRKTERIQPTDSEPAATIRPATTDSE